MPDRDTRGLLL